MRVVILHESPGADGPARELTDAASEFNRGLDIRLRFLEVGFELRTIPVRDAEAPPAVRLAETLRSFRPGVVLVLGRGPRLLECAAVAAKSRAPLAALVDGEPDRAVLAIARLAGTVIRHCAAGRVPLGPGARTKEIGAEDALGPALVRILVRLMKEGSHP